MLAAPLVRARLQRGSVHAPHPGRTPKGSEMPTSNKPQGARRRVAVLFADVSGFTPLAGRQQEMRTLSGLLDRLRQGHGAVVCLAGEAGIGKSRLKYEMKQLAGGIALLEGECSRIQAPPAYDVFAQIVREMLNLDLDDVQTDVWQKLRASLAELDPTLEEAGPYLGALLSLVTPVLVTEEEAVR